MAMSHVIALSVLIWSRLAYEGYAHTVITYPGWRGNNLILNSTFPYGMQWSYPCGGIPPTNNRTNWPVTGGAIAVQPGWFAGHLRSLIYINIGFGTDGPFGGPPNVSTPLVSPFQINGPSNNPYPGTFCLPEVAVPETLGVKIGDLATLQVVEASVHGAAQYNCIDIIFSSVQDAADVNVTNCFNSSTIRFSEPFMDPGALETGSSSDLNSTLWGDDPGARNSTALASCPVCPTATPTACPKTNGFDRREVGGGGMGVGLGLGMLVGQILG